MSIEKDNTYEVKSDSNTSNEASPSSEDEEKPKTENEENGEPEYPSGLPLALVMLSVTLAVFLVSLDNTIIATAIPKITDQFNSIGDVGWYGSSYLLATCSLQLFYGKLYTFFSIKIVFMVAVFIFEVGSAVCGASPSSNALIVGRAVAGMGAAGIFSGGLIIIAYTVPLNKRPLYTGMIGGVYGISSVIGPLLGGAFTDGPGWPWCFYINLPIGAITLALVFFLFKPPRSKTQISKLTWNEVKQLDLGGLAIFSVAIVCVLLALQWGGAKYAWGNWRIIVLLTIFGVMILVWIGEQWYMGSNATVPFEIIKKRTMAAAAVWGFLLGGCFFILIFWTQVWFQAIKGVSALRSGIMNLPLILGVVATSIASGAGTMAIGYNNPFYYACVVLTSIGCGLLTTLTADAGAGKWIGYQLIAGLGAGFGLQQALMTVQAVLPIEQVPVGTAVCTFTQIFGGALFNSVAQNVFNNRLIQELVQNVPEVNPVIVITAGATNLKTRVPQEFLSRVLVAYNIALTQSWYLSVGTACAAIIPAVFIEWKSMKGMKPGAPPPTPKEQ